MAVGADSSVGAATRNCCLGPQRPLEIHRSVKHLILDLPIGSKEGAYEIGLLSETGAPVLGSSGTARLEDQVVILRLDLDVSRVQSGRYFLALRQPGLE